ncbi:Rap family tetratricopeptide repeat protein [Bacillus pumilus]|uniref:Rap family tetratricopeptide repeat protein n=1 Tax=Bacillus pumilus TaxID=1408 RepID=UPI0011E90206|nr:Rap family tetratricopeptide repeat protein [Bacillus pumilus]TYS40430.1 tetratricopeptide repeat protein [Bacillus pumilus]
MGKIAVAVVGQVLNDWHLAIRKHNVEKAKQLKSQATDQIGQMEEDQKTIEFYQLLDFRHILLLHEARGVVINRDPDEIEAEKATDAHLEYLSWFYRGLCATHTKDYQAAMKYYRIAEKRLPAVQSEIEVAEYHAKVGLMYYMIDQYQVSLSHISEAVEIYKGYDDYILKIVTTSIVLMGNYIDLGRFEEAERTAAHAERVLERASNAQKNGEVVDRNLRNGKDAFLRAQIYHNYGILYSAAKRTDLSIQYLHKALENAEYESSPYFFNTAYLLFLGYLQVGDKEEALSWYIKGMHRPDKSKLFEYRAKILHSLYFDDTDIKTAETCFAYLDKLEGLNAYTEYKDLSKIAAEIFRAARLFEQSCDFLERALYIEQKLKHVEG